MLEKYLHIHPEVQNSISSGNPVIAIDSGILFNRISYPLNIEIANNISNIIRDIGAIPATTAIINGVLKVGLTNEELEFIASNKNTIKSSKKDLPFLITKKSTGFTTFTSSIILANLADIKILVTDYISNMSLEIEELSNTNISVVCSGINSLCSSKLNESAIKNNSVSIIGYKTNTIPIIDNLNYNLDVDYNLDSSMCIAEALKVKFDLDLRSGFLISSSTSDKNNIGLSSYIESLYNNAILASNISIDLSKLTRNKLF